MRHTWSSSSLTRTMATQGRVCATSQNFGLFFETEKGNYLKVVSPSKSNKNSIVFVGELVKFGKLRTGRQSHGEAELAGCEELPAASGCESAGVGGRAGQCNEG